MFKTTIKKVDDDVWQDDKLLEKAFLLSNWNETLNTDTLDTTNLETACYAAK